MKDEERLRSGHRSENIKKKHKLTWIGSWTRKMALAEKLVKLNEL
jgi:hypothetical protein